MELKKEINHMEKKKAQKKRLRRKSKGTRINRNEQR